MKSPPPQRLSRDDATLAETLAALEARPPHGRRRALRALGGTLLMAAPLPGFACALTPEETAGPFPGDGSNGPNALAMSGIVRSDIRANFGSAGTAVSPGTLLSLTLTLVNAQAGCAPLAGHAVYAWSCDARGRYSMYSPGTASQNFLRGVQVSDGAGKLTFTTVFPGCYPGRWPHIHFEVHASAARAGRGDDALLTSQVALPEAASRGVYAQTALYPSSAANLGRTSLASDGVFGDDLAALQMATLAGSAASGYVATLEVGIASRQ